LTYTLRAWASLPALFTPALAHTKPDMSGSGRPRTSSFAEPPGVPGAAAAAAGSAVAGGSSSGKTGGAQASAGSSSGFGNLKLGSEYHSVTSHDDHNKCDDGRLIKAEVLVSVA